MSATILRDTVTGQAWTLDATPEATLTLSATPTAHPVERGVEIVDHVQRQADTLTIQGVVTETPERAGPTGAARMAAWQAFLRGLIGGHPAQITTYRLGTLTNMVLTGVPIAVTKMRHWAGTLSFRQIRIVTATVSTIGAENSAAAVTNANVKTQSVTPATDLTTQLQSSIDAANLTVQYNLAAQPTAKAQTTPKQESAAYALAKTMGLL